MPTSSVHGTGSFAPAQATLPTAVRAQQGRKARGGWSEDGPVGDSLCPMTNPPEAPFGRVLTAMATAFHDDGSVDLDGTARIAAHLVEHGHDGVVVSGTTGESPTTTVEEDGQILQA